MSLLTDARQAIRIKTDTFDTELKDLIDAATLDLSSCGILKSKLDTLTTVTPDALLKQCIKLYCKANFGLDNTDSEKYQKAYEGLKTSLLLKREYTVEGAV